MSHEKHEGKLFGQYFASRGIDKEDACDRLGISHHAFSYHVNSSVLSNKFKAKLLFKDINLFEDEKDSYRFIKEYSQELEDKVEMLTHVIDLQKQFIAHVTKSCRKGNCLNFVLKKDMQTNSHS